MQPPWARATAPTTVRPSPVPGIRSEPVKRWYGPPRRSFTDSGTPGPESATRRTSQLLPSASSMPTRALDVAAAPAELQRVREDVRRRAPVAARVEGDGRERLGDLDLEPDLPGLGHPAGFLERLGEDRARRPRAAGRRASRRSGRRGARRRSFRPAPAPRPSRCAGGARAAGRRTSGRGSARGTRGRPRAGSSGRGRACSGAAAGRGRPAPGGAAPPRGRVSFSARLS